MADTEDMAGIVDVGEVIVIKTQMKLRMIKSEFAQQLIIQVNITTKSTKGGLE